MRPGKVSWGEVYSKGTVLGRRNTIMLYVAFNLENMDLGVDQSMVKSQPFYRVILGNGWAVP